MASADRDLKTAYNQIADIKNTVLKVEGSVEKINTEVQALRETEVRIETQIENYHHGGQLKEGRTVGYDYF